jgi:hypothetical protein
MLLRPWQQVNESHLLRVLSKYDAAADLSDPGTGKTYTATAVAKALDLPTLIVTPKAVIPTWNKVAKYLGTEFDVLNYEMLRTGRTPYFDGKQWHKELRLIIFDEAHRCAGIDSIQSEMLAVTRKQKIKTMILSATLADTPLELKAAGFVLGLHDGVRPPVTLRNFANPPVSFSQWIQRYGVAATPQGYFFKGTPEQQRAQMAKINASLLPEHGVRTRIDDLGDMFPPTQITAELYEISQPGRVDELYAQMADAMAQLRERAAGDRGGAFTELLRARQEVELLKVPIFVELAKDAAAQGMHVANFVNFSQTLEELCARLGTTCRVDGSQTGDKGARQRQHNVDRFQEDKEPYINCNSEAGGVGLSLHGQNRLALISPGHSAKTFRQVTGRVRRDGGGKSIQRVICLAGTVEEKLAKSLECKLGRLDALVDGDFIPV